MQSVTYQISTVSEATYQVKELAHSWGINGHSVRLFKSGNILNYETSKRATGQVIARSSISYTGCIDSVIEIMKMRHPLLKESGQVSFCPLYRTWCLEGKAVRLIKYKNQLSWSVSCATSFDIVRSFKESTIPSLICHKDTESLIEVLKEGRESHIASCLDKDFIVTRVLEEEQFKKESKERKEPKINKPPLNSIVDQGLGFGVVMGAYTLGDIALKAIGLKLIEGTALSIFGPAFVGIIIPLSAYEGYKAINKAYQKQDEVITNTSIERPIFIEIEPISVKSRIEERARVSKFTWSVTVITGPGGTAGNHTSILIEGIASSIFSFGASEGEYFMCQAHWIPPIQIRFISHDKFKIWLKKGIMRSHMYMRSSQKVSHMLTEIIKERVEHTKIIESGKTIEWTRWGKYSKHGDGTHNCMTWAMEKIALVNIDLGISKNPDAIIIPTTYTEPLSHYDLNFLNSQFSPQI